jgi:hypothetical protein
MITAKCVICLNKAFFYSGHVLKDGQKVTAGFCTYDHAYEGERIAAPNGCLGEWKPEYGLDEDMK